MSQVWRFAIALAVLIAVGGYAASSLAASDLDDVTPRETIVIKDDTDRQQPGDDRERPGQKGDDGGDDGRKTDDGDDVDVVQPDVDDLDDDDDAEPAERTDDRGDDG